MCGDFIKRQVKQVTSTFDELLPLPDLQRRYLLSHFQSL